MEFLGVFCCLCSPKISNTCAIQHENTLTYKKSEHVKYHFFSVSFSRWKFENNFLFYPKIQKKKWNENFTRSGT